MFRSICIRLYLPPSGVVKDDDNTDNDNVYNKLLLLPFSHKSSKRFAFVYLLLRFSSYYRFVVH